MLIPLSCLCLKQTFGKFQKSVIFFFVVVVVMVVRNMIFYPFFLFGVSLEQTADINISGIGFDFPTFKTCYWNEHSLKGKA